MMSAKNAESPTAPRNLTRRRRISLIALASALVIIASAIDPLAREALSEGRVMGSELLQLRLAYNSGVAFSLGDQLPTVAILAVTATITVAIGVFAWRTAPTNSLIQNVGLAAVVAGATANVIDRLSDGRVTDYFHTGWWPTFNLADTYITCGVVLLLAALLLESTAKNHTPRESEHLSQASRTETTAARQDQRPPQQRSHLKKSRLR